MKILKTILCYIFLIIVGLCIGAGMVDLFVKPFLPKSNKEQVIENQRRLITLQDSFIDKLILKNDSLKITRTEFEEAVKLLKKYDQNNHNTRNRTDNRHITGKHRE